MAEPRQVTFRLEEPLRESAAAGRHNFINLMAGVLGDAGYGVEFADLSAPVRDHSLTHMAAPPDDRGLVFRRAYHYPFWQIDPLPQRWHWAVARRPFDAAEVPKDALRFFDFWRRRLFGEAPSEARRGGFLYLPLQGHLRRQRSFQRCTPLEMVAAVAETGRQAVVTLHPKEAYAAADRAALAALVARHDNLRLGTDDMVTLLRDCDGVVTMNSAVAFSGYFFEKPALLYAGRTFTTSPYRVIWRGSPSICRRLKRTGHPSPSTFTGSGRCRRSTRVGPRPRRGSPRGCVTWAGISSRMKKGAAKGAFHHDHWAEIRGTLRSSFAAPPWGGRPLRWKPPDRP